MRKGRTLMAAGALALAVVAVAHPNADIRLETHDLGDPAPRRVMAAVDVGLLAVSVLVTWTGRRLAR